ncbi:MULTISPECIES: formaldehyde-responsive transcriptional repressor FrmR [Gammaproteobacteria]|uniref:Formaldehyde-responsive transcriptional repressor FrmR n=3 Tax=Gammaproteobacteria TaxID=1236 RepID=A0AAJ2WK93_STEMA|nr:MULTISPECIES: formaldehyde-responsive transcriptional repressor FrmR [Gammaproteobacteria]AVK15365.1 transcriptional repressor FrmR [Pseudomonas aeruginosa]ELM1752204.1 formaldehyde-responsive transcriptional repressor FrmR [Pseudomonas aeruginosa]EMB9254167.1 formaldehyde-responsive transcriptional repressor FrmR [Pseudomonas aeruginosa]MBG6734809.1 formaldehyde-responsive transcriptional repressor FrmR [Pseudomonas aeruginosa]MBH3791397.1 formaldehyde-responsive transcriptional repressor 
MPHSPEEKKQALTRIRRIKGQVATLEQALDAGAGAECPAILQQLAAVRGAVNGLMATVLESYLREEFPSSEIRSDSQNKSIDETISIVRSYLR